ncbi:MAG: IS630 family transposase [Defluviitaleaceae bacterium]|nr:IS630 family transposase [Defluviitaleaceae bacterium]MCL2836543.1 IS630 family transposase [Defluviitaleaceae bacterium]
MEDVLEVYQCEYDENYPVICMDEKPYQLPGECREPIPMKPGDVKRYDSEYIRNGTCSIFVFTEPLKGRRNASVSPRRTKKDWARHIAELPEVHYPNAPKICLVMDNHNTHAISSLYDTFPPDRARALARRLEIHYTPKHGSWLNIAEIELNAMTSQCLRRRIPSINASAKELDAWNSDRNSSDVSAKWQKLRLCLENIY